MAFIWPQDPPCGRLRTGQISIHSCSLHVLAPSLSTAHWVPGSPTNSDSQCLISFLTDSAHRQRGHSRRASLRSGNELPQILASIILCLTSNLVLQPRQLLHEVSVKNNRTRRRRIKLACTERWDEADLAREQKIFGSQFCVDNCPT